MCNEGVFAYPLTKLSLAEDVGCGECRTVGRDDTDLRFHVVFQPRGYMSPSYFGSPGNHTRPWDVSPPLRLLSAEGQKKAKERAKEIATEYRDYQPLSFGFSTDYKEEIKAASKMKTKRVPGRIMQVRFQKTSE